MPNYLPPYLKHIMILPPITPRQQAILKLLYNHRFLDRVHIQLLLNHTDHHRINSWLKDLREKDYVDWKYDTTCLVTKATPAVYYLKLNGIRFLRTTGEYTQTGLRKRYKEATRTQIYIDRCLLVADCYVSLQRQRNTTKQYNFWTCLDVTTIRDKWPELIELQPHLFFKKQSPDSTTVYLLEIFDTTTPRYRITSRINAYLQYIAWGEGSDAEVTTVAALFICPTTADLLYAKRRTTRLLEAEGLEDIPMRFTTAEKVKTLGITGSIWEDA